MAIFYTDSGSFNLVEVSSSLAISGSGSRIFTVSGSRGGLMEVSDILGSGDIFTISSASIDVFRVRAGQIVTITGSLGVLQGITGSLLGTASNATTSSFAISASNSLTASFALNAGGGGGFPFAGFAVVTGSLAVTSGSGVIGTFLTASETLLPGDFINIGVGGVRRANSDDTTKQAHGFVTASIATSGQATVFYSGLNTFLTGLIPGTRYFLSSSASASAAPPTAIGKISQEIGVAVNSTSILVNIGPAIIT